MAEFDRRVRENRLEAEEALKRIPEIRGYIDRAEQTTQEARSNLNNAETDALVAKEVAEIAKTTAEKTYLVWLLPSDFVKLSNEK